MASQIPSVIIDNSSYNIKAGYSCDNHPLAIFRNVVGRPNYLYGSYGQGPYDVYFGDEAIEKCADLELSYPVKNGRIVHWDNMERIWHHVYYKELRVSPGERPVLLACSTAMPMDEKMKCAQVFFEVFCAPSISVQPQSMLSLYGSGVTTGICVDLGFDNTDISPGFEGGLIAYAHMVPEIAGSELNKYIEDSLYKKGYDFGIVTPLIAEDILRKHCYVSTDPDSAFKETCIYQLPDGEDIDVSDEMFTAGEAYFSPELIPKSTYINEDQDVRSIHNAIVTSALKCDADLRPELYETLVLCGGFGQLPGLEERLIAEIKKGTTETPHIVSSTEAYGVSWLGGAAFAELPGVQDVFVTKAQYEECGGNIMRHKFI